MGFLLNIVASIIKWILQPVCWLWGAAESLVRGEFNDWNKDLAEAKDIFGNILIKYPANLLLIKDTGYKFGQLPDKISKVFGRNKLDSTLKIPGEAFCIILNDIEKNHVENAVKK